MHGNSGPSLFTVQYDTIKYSKQSIIQQASGITSAAKLIVARLALTTSSSIFLSIYQTSEIN